MSDDHRYKTFREWGYPDVEYRHGPSKSDHRVVIDGFKVPAITSVTIEDDVKAGCPRVTVTFLAASVNKPASVSVNPETD